MRKLFFIRIQLVGVLLAFTILADAQSEARTDWYEQARFGLFIHWGAYSQLDGEYRGRTQHDPKGEWIMRNLKIPVAEYRDSIARTFNPTGFDADAWVKSAHDAGMRYLVVTTKHHDGFALYDSKTSGYNLVSETKFGRDAIRELADACHRYGMAFGVYYSQAQDWYHGGGLPSKAQWDEAQRGSWDDYFTTIVHGQLEELLTEYGPVRLIWFDSARAVQNRDLADELGRKLRQEYPDVLLNSRLGGNEDFADFKTYEQVIPALPPNGSFELCLTHNRSWSYKPSDTEWKSPEFILKTLIHMASIGGNFLFNVGPKPDGTFPTETTETLDYLADWMKDYAESIHGTEASPFYRLNFGKSTLRRAGDTTFLYLHVFNYPAKGRLYIPGLLNQSATATLLGSGQELNFRANSTGAVVELPESPVHPDVNVVRLTITEPLRVDPGYLVPNADGSILLEPKMAVLTTKPQYDHLPELVETDERSYFQNWTIRFPHRRFKAPATRAHWLVDVPKMGTYRAYISVATDTDANLSTLETNRKKSRVALPHTGGFEQFEEVDLGMVELRKGLNELSFGSAKNTEIWTDVRVGTLRLVPVR